ncbi:unnamed protein product [Calicophoron daubneyi]|uniref:ER membrane protein complex subunit 7 beta-sandwich domain-containing protein n=1 Tax=Calicophoron daubneyi TaxID=300641 RepID=A0AAV2TVJ9_CALDB
MLVVRVFCLLGTNSDCELVVRWPVRCNAGLVFIFFSQMWMSIFLCFQLVGFGLVQSYVIEGTIVAPPGAPADWHIHTRVHVDGTQHLGFVRSDGSFEVPSVPSGSYVVEPINPTFVFQTARVDINSKGRIRARRVNAPQPNAVKELPYPLRLASNGRAIYFKPREQMRTIDLLFSSHVLYVLVPFLLVMVLTKFVNTNDPELQKELKQMNLQRQLPDMSELLSSMPLFGGQKKPPTSRRRITADESRTVSTHGEGTSAQGSTSSGRRAARRSRN